jgi:transcriptional regulator with XRE-family HTH domain
METGARLNDDFAARLQALMDERGLNQSDLAAKLWGRGVDAKGSSVAKGRDRIWAWVNGKSCPNRTNVIRLAQELGVETSDLGLRQLPQARREPTGVALSFQFQVNVRVSVEVAFKILELLHKEGANDLRPLEDPQRSR